MKKVLKNLVVMVLVVSIAVVPIFASNGMSGGKEVVKPYSAIEQLYGDVFKGYEDGLLHGEYFLTRAEFATLLCNAFSDTVFTEVYYEFSDLKADHWASDYIQKAVNAGWLEGYEDGTFKPDENITYEEALTVICRVLEIDGYNYSYPEDYVAKSIEYSLTNGVSALMGEKVTRNDAAEIIVNSFEYLESVKINEYENANGNWSVAKAFSGGSSAKNVAPTGYAYLPEDADCEDFVEIYNTEEYHYNDENVFKNVLTSPLSTFSIDTDTASYSNLRRFILNGQDIPYGSVRSEELINYFDYKKAEIEDGETFGVNYTVDTCPWNKENKLAMITISGEELTEYAPSNIVLLIDTSGSMNAYNKLPLVKSALSMLLESLGEKDTIAIVTYASGTRVALEPTPATEKETILNTIESLSAYGSTAGASGINLAYEQAEKGKLKNGNNRIILCTDGDFNVGISSDAELTKLIETKRESGIYLSVLGFGMGNYKDSKMENLADKGNGNYAYIDNLREAKKVLVDEMSKTIYTIAKDVKIQVEFNPEKVSEYRLIGYENRLLNNEDFDNDKKDAGELGAGATVTVLYELVPKTDNISDSLRYQNVSTTGSDELMFVKIRHKKPDGNESILSEYVITDHIEKSLEADFNFAAAVAELGMILTDSEYIGESTFDSVITLAKEGLGEDKFGLRNEFVQLVDLLKFRKHI